MFTIITFVVKQQPTNVVKSNFGSLEMMAGEHLNACKDKRFSPLMLGGCFSAYYPLIETIFDPLPPHLSDPLPDDQVYLPAWSHTILKKCSYNLII